MAEKIPPIGDTIKLTANTFFNYVWVDFMSIYNRVIDIKNFLVIIVALNVFNMMK